MKALDKVQLNKSYDQDFFSSLSIFGALSNKFIDHIVDKADIFIAEPGDILFSEEEYTDSFYTLIDGKFDLYKGPESDGIKFNTLSSGECIGYVSMLCMQPILGDVVCKSRSLVLRINNNLYSSLPDFNLSEFSMFIMNLSRDLGRAYIKNINNSFQQ